MSGRITELERDPLRIPCPVCGAKTGERCVGPGMSHGRRWMEAPTASRYRTVEGT